MNLYYEELEDCYIRLTGGAELKELLFDFGKLAEKDIELCIQCLDSNGNCDNKKVIWEEGTSFKIVELGTKTYDSFLISSSDNFSISSIYYAAEHKSRVSKSVLFFLFAIASVFFCIFLSRLAFVEKIFVFLEERILRLVKSINKNKKKCFFLFGILVCSTIVSVLICNIILSIKKVILAIKLCI